MAGDWRTLKLEVLAETASFVKGMNAANKQTETFGDKLVDFGKKAALAFAAVGAAAGAMAVKIGKEAIQAASDLAETTSKVDVIFGTTAKNIEDFGATAAASLGQTRTQAMNAAATFGIFGKSAGLAGDDLSGFSIEFVRLASDLASFNNTSVDQAINALGAALRGEAEPIRAFGVLLNDATLKAKALEMGIYDGTGSLTAQQKVLAAHQVILSQTTDAQGDFARTADGMANSQRILTARLDEAKIVLGTALLPIALQVVNFFNENFLPVIEKLAGSFGEPGGLLDNIRQTVSQMRDNLQPILSALQSAFNQVSTAIINNKGNFEALFNLVSTLWEFFKTYFVPLLKSQVVNAILGIGTAFSTIVKIISPIIGVISNAITGILNLIDGAIQRINSLIKAYNKIPFLPDIPTLPTGSVSKTSGSNTVSSSSLPSGFSTSAPVISGAPKISQSTSSAAANPVTINVNAPSVIDETGFTRAVANAIQNTVQRGSAGGGAFVPQIL